jgi:hypothetical protein
VPVSIGQLIVQQGRVTRGDGRDTLRRRDLSLRPKVSSLMLLHRFRRRHRNGCSPRQTQSEKRKAITRRVARRWTPILKQISGQTSLNVIANWTKFTVNLYQTPLAKSDRCDRGAIRPASLTGKSLGASIPLRSSRVRISCQRFRQTIYGKAWSRVCRLYKACLSANGSRSVALRQTMPSGYLH